MTSKSWFCHYEFWHKNCDKSRKDRLEAIGQKGPPTCCNYKQHGLKSPPVLSLVVCRRLLQLNPSCFLKNCDSNLISMVFWSAATCKKEGINQSAGTKSQGFMFIKTNMVVNSSLPLLPHCHGLEAAWHGVFEIHPGAQSIALVLNDRMAELGRREKFGPHFRTLFPVFPVLAELHSIKFNPIFNDMQ